MTFPLGKTVTYYSESKGEPKLAIITANSSTIVKDGGLPELSDNHYAIAVFSPTGSIYPKFGVPDFSAEGINKDEYTIDGKPRGVIVSTD